jgi:capsular polysaccharide biosynthesis protein
MKNNNHFPESGKTIVIAHDGIGGNYFHFTFNLCAHAYKQIQLYPESKILYFGEFKDWAELYAPLTTSYKSPSELPFYDRRHVLKTAEEYNYSENIIPIRMQHHDFSLAKEIAGHVSRNILIGEKPVPNCALIIQRDKSNNTTCRNFSEECLNSIKTEMEKYSDNVHVIYPEKMSAREQIIAFNSAKYVVGVHGAGLSNIMYMQPNTNVLEIRAHGYDYPLYEWLGKEVGVKFTRVLSKKYPDPLPESMKNSDGSINHLAYKDVEIENTEEVIRQFMG